MRTLRINLCVVVILLIAFSLTLTSCSNSGQDKNSTQSQNDQKKNEAIKKIKEIYDKTIYNNGGVESILAIADKATMNFDTYVYLADLAHEFGYSTGLLVELADYASKTKFETDYFKQLADISMMEGGPVTDLAEKISKQDKPDKSAIENEIQKLKTTTKFKTMEEARAANKDEIDKLYNKKSIKYLYKTQ